MRKLHKRVLSALLIICMSAGCIASSPVYAEESKETIIDVSDVGNGSVVEHTHIYQTYHDEHYHWEQCIVCGDKRGRASHTLVGNGGSKVLFSDYYNTAYREVCNCGYKSLPQIVILGTHQNYPNGGKSKITYTPLNGTPLSSIKQITLAEYNSLKSSYQALPGATYEWWDYDGDGYGYVFASSLIVGAPSYGTKGTIELIVGSEGDCGRKKAYDEYYSLVAYIRSDSTPTRVEFVSYLKNRIAASKNPTAHALYGYDTKYQSGVTDTQFSQLISIAKHINYHAPSWGCGSTVLTYDSIFTAPGCHYYASFQAGCYDSNIKKDIGWSAGYAGTCDVCGKTYTGNESYTNTSWINCNDGNKQSVRNVNGATHTCSGHDVYGPGQVLLGRVYCHFKNEKGKIYISYTATAASGYTASIANTGWFEMKRSDKERAIDYTNGVTTVTFSKGGTAVRSMYLGYYYILNDNTAPVPYGYSDILTSNNYWQISGNGSAEKISTNARIRVSFSDPDQYSLNSMSVRMLDSDGNTVIKQANGDTVIPLTRISGTPGTGGGAGIWQGTLDINAEVNGTKLIFLQAIDATGNLSEPIPMQIQYLDSKGPEIKVVASDNLNKWSKEKTFTVTATDAFGTVYLGTCNEDLKLVSNDSYKNTRTYIVKGNLTGEKAITFYAKDKCGNLSYKTVNLSKLDNMKPKFTGIKVTDVFDKGEAVAWKITTGGTDGESGLSGLAITKTSEEPDQTAYKTVNEIIIPRSGIYYIWLKDNVGNITRSDAVHIHSDLEYNGIPINEVEYNGVRLNYFYYNGRRLRL